MKAKNQRLLLAALAIFAIAAAAVLALSALKDQAAFFYAPSDLKKDGLPLGRSVRLGGMVEAGSIKRLPDGVTIDFRRRRRSGNDAGDVQRHRARSVPRAIRRDRRRAVPTERTFRRQQSARQA